MLEGEVHVQQGTTEKKLLPGEQVATSPAMASPPIAEGIAWSRDAGALVGLLQQATVEVPAAERQNPETPRDMRAAFETIAIRPSAPGTTGGRGGGVPVGACSGTALQVDASRFAVRNIRRPGWN